jgi:RNA polymerase sigma-70 factor, ECF subfamily
MENANGRGKLEELENVITEFQDQLFRFAFFRTGSLADSQDIVQEVFMKLYKENNHLSTVINLRFYLFRSIANACIDYQRKNKKLKFETLDKVVIPNDLNEKDASHGLILAEEYRRIEELLRKLPADQAETIRMRVLDELSFTEIATVQGIPVTTVKSRFKYGIDKLKQSLKIKGGKLWTVMNVN